MGEELNTALLELAERGAPHGAAAVLEAARLEASQSVTPDRPAWYRALAVAVGAAAVVLVLLGAVILIVRPFGGEQIPTAITEPTTTAATPDVTDPPEGATTVPAAPIPGAEATGPLNDVSGVAIAADGSLWTATRGGVVQWDLPSGVPVVFGEGDGLPSASVSAVAAAADGGIWITGQEWVGHYDGSWTFHTSADVPALDQVDPGALAVGPDGTVWVAMGLDTLLRFDGETWTSVSPPSSEASPWTGSMAVAPNGTLWATTHWPGSVVAYDGDTWRQYTEADGLPGLPSNVATAADGTVWVGGTGIYGDPDGDIPAAGIARFDGTGWTAYTTANGLLFNDADVVVGPEGVVWAVHTGPAEPERVGLDVEPVPTGGISQYDGSAWTTVPDVSGQGRGAAVAPDGTLWMPSSHGVVGFDGTDMTQLTIDADTDAATAGSASITLTPAPDVDPVRVTTTVGDFEFTTLQFPPGHGFWQVEATPHGFVAIDDSTSLRWSSDGVHWEGIPVPVDPWRLTAAGDDVIVHGRDGAARYTWNGTSWEETARLDLSGIVEWIAFGPKGAVAVSGTTMSFAPDGLHFRAAEQGPSKDLPQAGASLEGDLLPHIAAGGCDGGFVGEGVGPGSIGPVLATTEGFVALTATHPDDWNRTPSCEPLLWFSTDGSTWNLSGDTSPFGENAFVSSITERDGRFVAIGGVGEMKGRVWVSDDGLIWEQAEIDLGLAGTVAVGELGWMLTGVADMGSFSATQHLWFSNDGRVWDGPHERPEALRSGYLPPALAVGPDMILGVGMWDSPVPVIARLSD